MRTGSESPNSPSAENGYRAARRAFIAACDGAHVDAVARLHPSKGPDGKPLFMDCAALGPRHAARALLVLGYDASGTDILMSLLRDIAPPSGARLVLVHAVDPAAFAEVARDAAWPPAMLEAVATEDLSHVRELAVLTLCRQDQSLTPVLQGRLPHANITSLPPAASAAQAQDAAAAFFAAP